MEQQLKIDVVLKNFASREVAKIDRDIKVFGLSATKTFKSITSAVFSLKGAIAAAGAGLGAVSFIETAGQVQQVSKGFRELSNAAGIDFEKSLVGLRRGVRGTIDDLELMKQANAAMLLGVGRSAEELEFLSSAARRLGSALGRDAKSSLESLTEGLGKQSALRLDNLGIIVKEEAAYRALAKELKVTVETLTDAEKRYAFQGAALEGIREKLSRLGPDVLTAADAWGQLKSEVQNTVQAIAQEFAPEIKRVLEGAASGISHLRPVLLGFLADMVEGVGSFSATAVESSAVITDWIGSFKKLALEFQRVRTGAQLLNQDLLDLSPFDDQTEEIKKLELAYQGLSEQIESLKLGGESAALRAASSAISKGAGELSARLRVAAKNAQDLLDIANFVGPKFEDIFEIIGPPTEEQQRATEALTKALGDQGNATRQLAKDEKERAEAEKEYFEAQIKARDAAFQYEVDIREAKKAAFEEGMREVAAARDADRERVRENIEIQKDLREARKRSHDEGLRYAAEQRDAWLHERDAMTGIKDGLTELGEDFQKWGLTAKKVVLDVAQALESNTTNAILSVIEGTASAKQAFRDFAKSVLKDIARIIIQLIVMKTIQAAAGGIGGLISGTGGAYSTHGNRKGGIVHGHLEPVLGHAQAGTVARRRGLYELREGPHDEAVVPLLDNRAVPVRFLDPPAGSRRGRMSGGGVTINLYYTLNATTTVQEQAMIRRQAEQISSIIAEKMNSSLSFRERMAA